MEELAIASVPMQKYRQLYPAQRALRRGTIFAELDKPWAPRPKEEEEHEHGSSETRAY